MPIGGGAGLCFTTCLGICRSSLRASTSSIRWIVHEGVCLGVGQGRERLSWRRGAEPTIEIVVEVPDKSPQNFGVVTVEKNITYLKKIYHIPDGAKL